MPNTVRNTRESWGQNEKWDKFPDNLRTYYKDTGIIGARGRDKIQEKINKADTEYYKTQEDIQSKVFSEVQLGELAKGQSKGKAFKSTGLAPEGSPGKYMYQPPSGGSDANEEAPPPVYYDVYKEEDPSLSLEEKQQSYLERIKTSQPEYYNAVRESIQKQIDEEGSPMQEYRSSIDKAYSSIGMTAPTEQERVTIAAAADEKYKKRLENISKIFGGL